MSETATTDVREWLKANHPEAVSERGRLSAAGKQLYADAHPGADYRDGVGPDDFTQAGDPPDDPADYPPADPPADRPAGGARGAEQPSAESKPRRVRSTRRKPRSRIGAWLTGEQKPKTGGAAKKRLPRVPLDRMIERVWSQLAEAAPAPPLEKMLYAQAPFAGMVIEDALAGTVVDRMLQPIARAEDKAIALGGLIGPPLFIVGVMATAPEPCEKCEGRGGIPVPGDVNGALAVCQACRGGGTEPPSFEHKAALGGLRLSLMAMTEAMGDRMDQVMERAAENKERGRQVERFIDWLFEIPKPGAGDVEDEAVRRATEMAGRAG